MLKLDVGAEEYFDDSTQKFVIKGHGIITLEHSLVSLSKWEQITEKPFLGAGEKTDEEVMLYIQCMSLDDEIPPEVFSKINQNNIDRINDYINEKHTATWFFDDKNDKRNQEVITSELIYYWLIAYEIPFEVQYWHLNRLFTLVKVVNIKNSPPKKMSMAEIQARNRKLNDERRKALGTEG